MLKQDEVCHKNIFKVFPNLDRDYFKNAFFAAIHKGNPYFFSSKIHKNIISEKLNINFKINRLINNDKKFLLMEFIDITNEFIRVKQLKEYLNELSLLNEKLQIKEKEIEKLVFYDSLTNMGNRALFYSLAEKLLASARRNNSILGLMFIDLDKFKSINDSFGHSVGDRALMETAKELALSIRDSDLAFRFGGDEFLILLPGLDSYDSYKIVAERIMNSSKRIRIDENSEIMVSLSIGASFYPRDGDTIDELILKADQAMYSVKQMGGDKYTNYTCAN